MGVNMPARTVVFAGDSPQLNPLNYRQMMGRAGRRGYDNVGNVIFYGVPPRKLSYLMTSRLMSLHGHFPITTTYSLRALQLYKGFENKENSLSILSNLFQEPFSGRSMRPNILKQIKHQFRCSLEYQVQNHLITSKGVLSGLSGLVSHLHEYEPDNYTFAKIIESGYLHKLCDGYKTKLSKDVNSKDKKLVRSKLLLVICHVFNRIPFPSTYDPFSNPLLENESFHNSQILLPLLEEQNDSNLRAIAKIIDKHNSHSKNMFSEYFRIFAQSTKSDNKSINTLLQSNIKICTNNTNNKNNTNNTNNKNNTVICELIKRCNNYIARSPFSSVSGLDDRFNSISEFCESMRNDMAIEFNSIPITEWKDLRGRNLRLNGYAYDFHHHEIFRKILKQNNMTDPVAWYSLKSVDLVLKKIMEALKNISNYATEKETKAHSDSNAIDELESKYTKLRQHKYSIYRNKRGQHYKNIETGEIIHESQLEKLKDKLRGKSFGDDFVCAFSDLKAEFGSKFADNPTDSGPIANISEQS